MATDKLINSTQGDDIIEALSSIADNIENVPSSYEFSSAQVVSMVGYEKAAGAAAISQADTLNRATGKLEYKVDANNADIQSILDGTTIDSFGDVETALSGKQATLTTEQLSAVNSGIDSTKVGQIATNQSDISSLASNTVPKTRTINGNALSSDITLTAANVGAIATTAKGANGGVAELDANGKVPSSQLPSYVDDVLEYSSTSAFPATGETGKIYVDTTTNKTYRWGGSTYVEISASLALGDTSSTAYYGDKGKTAYDHATDSSRLTTATASGLYKVASTAQGHIASLTPVEKADITALGIPGSDTNTHRPIKVNSTQLLGDNTTALDIVAGSNVTLTPDTSTGKVTIAATDTTYSAATQSAAGLMSSTDKTKLDGIASGAQVNSITGVKGNSESTYRTGNVNITATNIGLGNVGNFKAVSTVASQGLSSTEQANARANIGAGTSSLTIGTSSTTAAAGDHTHNYAGSSSAGGPALSVSTKGGDVQIGTPSSSSDDCGDIVFLYGNGSEKMRIWTDSTYTAKSGPNIRIFNASGTQLFTGKIPLSDGTGASGTWNITATNATKATTADRLKLATTRCKVPLGNWNAKTWSGLTKFNGYNIWTDGTNIYQSSGSDQYVLSGSTWTAKTWSGLTSFYGEAVWTDGTNIYYSLNTSHYVLSGSTWTAKTWSGLTNFNGSYVWTDGANIYYSNDSVQYVLSGSTWTAKTWSGLTSFYGKNVWTDGAGVYCSDGSVQYVLSGSTWSTKTWTGLTAFSGSYIWSDGANIYYSGGSPSSQYALSGSTWSARTWSTPKAIRGDNVWTDGTNIYFSTSYDHYVLTSMKSVR